ncbi:stage V sporulation protein AA [Cytobacillus sp. IB215665]|uniref:stage V sporulation protein AA n=1 Tax=Cytobacillus sp. IB215665 TaxID=3097357 RepID=UPI002A137210|nr:stage V sporulation protein AA [Cytobacillus sp. IB215665]MDX8364770.1 stage V sporulation protein AA [Cytobacillus sp. IB215665]
MTQVIYVRMYNKVQAKLNSVITVGDIAKVIADEQLAEKVREINVHRIRLRDKNILVVDVTQLIEIILCHYPKIEVQTIGPSQTIIEVNLNQRKYHPVFFLFIWLLLFVGAAIAIMNFHEDVSMQKVHQRLYLIITGEKVLKPLLLQVPYSIGLGLGMILFFNHLFKKRINEEPSPLEVEMFKYQLDLDHYVIINENKESLKKTDVE